MKFGALSRLLLIGSALLITAHRLPAPISEIETGTQAPKEAVVFDPPTNLRASPNGAIILSIKQKRRVEIIRQEGDWFFVRVDNFRGYIHKNQLAP